MDTFRYHLLCHCEYHALSQVLLEAGDTISDSDIDSILGLGGIDDGLSEDEVGLEHTDLSDRLLDFLHP